MNEQLIPTEFTFERHDPGTYSLIDLQAYLPEDWERKVLDAVAQYGYVVDVVPSSTSRHDEERTFRLRTIDGQTVREQLPWLLDLYHGVFSQIVGEGIGEIIGTTIQDEYAAMLNILGAESEDPYEPHIDNNGATLVLPVTDHVADEGAELVLSLSGETRGFFPFDDPDSIVIKPQKGHGIIFNGSNKPHYVCLPKTGQRVTIIFEYYTRAANESHRPDDLSVAIGLKRTDLS